MTWVVAHASPAAVALIGDLRITVTTEDSSREVTDIGVKKVHHVAPNIVVGFAGNIAVGFQMVEELRVFCSDRSPITSALTVAEEWCDHMRDRFWEIVRSDLWRRECHLILAGFHPTPPESGSPRIPIGTGSILECPLIEGDSFKIVRQFGWKDRAVSIGSGTGVDEYRRLLDEFDWLQAAQMPDSHVMLGAVVQWTINRQPTIGVSTDVIGHVLVGARDGFFAETVALGDLVKERNKIAVSSNELMSLLERTIGSASLNDLAGKVTY